MPLDPQSSKDLHAICENGLKASYDHCHDRDREDVFYIPVVIAIAIRHGVGNNTRVIGCDIAFDDSQPLAGIIDVLDTCSGVLKGKPSPNVRSTLKIVDGVELGRGEP